MEEGLVKSAARAIRILSIFADVRKPQRASEISQFMGIPLSSCVALLDTLVAEGALSYEYQSRRYFPTESVRRMGSWLDRVDFLELQGTAAARRVSRALGCTVALGQASGHQVEWVFVAGGLETKVGARVPLCASPAGIALLSLRAPEDVAAAVEAHNTSLDGRRLSTADVQRLAAQAADCGHAIGYDATGQGHHNLAMAVASDDSAHEIVLNLILPEVRVRRFRTQILQSLSASVQASFGTRAGPTPLMTA